VKVEHSPTIDRMRMRINMLTAISAWGRGRTTYIVSESEVGSEDRVVHPAAGAASD
jgi:hypothetical protein